MMNRFRRTSDNSKHQTPTTKKRNLFNRNKSSSSSNNSFHHPPLSQFDACIEACDALAASSSRQTSALVTERQDGHHTNQEGTIPNCSVLVSPDGALLFTSNEDTAEKYSWTKSNSHHPTIGHEEEYESAILTGDDLKGDYEANGFSARGWDVDAASNALNATKGVFKCMESFVEGVALCQKEKSAGIVGCCEQWSSGLEKVRLQHSLKLEMGGSRVGPLLSDASSLANAISEMEQYYSLCAEASSDRWREACCDEYHRQLSSSTQREDADPRSDPSNTINAPHKGAVSKRAIDESLIQGLLPKMKYTVQKAEERTRERELALSEVRSKVADAQDNLMKHKEWSSTRWQRVKDENRKIDEIVNQEVKQQNELMQKLRLEKDSARLEVSATEGTMSDHDLWEMVKDVGSMEEFEHTGYSPRIPHKVPTLEGNEQIDTQTKTTIEDEDLPHIPNVSRAEIEKGSDIHELRRAALEADDLVEDAAGALLNIMSKLDTTRRSARIAAESGLLSECNAAHQCLRSIVEIERADIQEKMERLQKLEAAIEAVNVRNDIDNYIRRDKTFPGGTSRGGESDDGGVAAALAVLNSHSDDCFDASRTNITRPNFFKGWADDEDGSDDEIEPDFFKAVIKSLFVKKPDGRDEDTSKQEKLEEALSNLNSVLSENSQQGCISRQAILYELNNQRSIGTEIEDKGNFESICDLFDSFLTGCGREAVDVSNAKMLMILSQTFYYAKNEDNTDVDDRTIRLYVKDKISSHDIWKDDYFWDQALYQCVSEALKKSGVLLNYVKPNDDSPCAQKNIKWHDLSPKEYPDAAAQVHSVVFAQLGTLSHSMLELDCGISRACGFVRRLSIRYQLPLSLRITLIQHLIKSEAKTK